MEAIPKYHGSPSHYIVCLARSGSAAQVGGFNPHDHYRVNIHLAVKWLRSQREHGDRSGRRRMSHEGYK